MHCIKFTSNNYTTISYIKLSINKNEPYGIAKQLFTIRII